MKTIAEIKQAGIEKLGMVTRPPPNKDNRQWPNKTSSPTISLAGTIFSVSGVGRSTAEVAVPFVSAARAICRGVVYCAFAALDGSSGSSRLHRRSCRRRKNRRDEAWYRASRRRRSRPAKPPEPAPAATAPAPKPEVKKEIAEKSKPIEKKAAEEKKSCSKKKPSLSPPSPIRRLPKKNQRK